jgi:fructose-1,6-bisphosphatase
MLLELFPVCGETKLRLLMPVDPLTRLMMEADGVSVSEMEALMRRISRTLAQRSVSRGAA